ncbi:MULTISPECIES: archaellin/type IV pilin N-terminal domain-containing protein [Methanoculleus]|uniref:Flagellin n=2 Tax=Methanoculleus TaxID=45989 RepID=A3CVA3_METMJ|nr:MULTISPECIES: archaellin/type IV pilin N-terminal domain-containing protein [Methanoculleus]ABN57303.1 flagellin [Methanoculleus marisnigri JR1]MCC7555449.1 flagellin [Methanoculleus marisnigri]UYU18714.1 flagellin [Methanoculleus submarinus]
MSTSNSSEAGFTGLEAAIVLIAFVVVAAVFAYVVLGAGILFSEESRSVVHQGIQEAGSSLTVTGCVYGVSSTPGIIHSIIVPVGLTAGSEPIDITTVSVRLIGSTHKETVRRNDPLIDVVPAVGRWSVQERLNADSDHLLEAGELYVLNVSPDGKSDCTAYRTFAVEIKPAGRPALRVERTVPGSVTTITRLD